MKNRIIASKITFPVATATIFIAVVLLLVLTVVHFPIDSSISGWIWSGISLLVAIAAVISLFQLVRQIRLLRKVIAETYLQAANELGRVASGLAHEIGNPLHALRLNLHTFRRVQEDRQSLPSEEVGQMLDESVAAIDRIDALLQQSKNFVASAEQRLEVFNLNAELEAIVDFLSLVLQQDNVEVALALPNQPVSIRMDRARLRQIVLNLLQNARDFMNKGGRIDLEMSRKDGDVEIVVSDQGRGIAEADLPHIFEPFFTTRDDGIGLGLALAKRFVRETGGKISCEPNEPRGTRFHVNLSGVAVGKNHRETKSA